MVSGLFLWLALRYGTGYQTVWAIRPSAETPSSVHWRRFYSQLTGVPSTLELSGRCILQIYLLTHLLICTHSTKNNMRMILRVLELRRFLSRLCFLSYRCVNDTLYLAPIIRQTADVEGWPLPEFIWCSNTHGIASSAIGLPPVPDFPGCPGFATCCPASRQDQPRDDKCPGFQGAVKMTIIMK